MNGKRLLGCVFLLGIHIANRAEGPVRFDLQDGLRLVCFQDNASEVTHLQFFIGGGRAAEPDGKAGLAYLTTRLMLEIGDNFDMRSIVESGAAFQCEVAGDYSSLSVRCLSANLETIVEVMAGGLTDPILSSLRIGFIRDQMKSFRQLEEESPFRKIDLMHGFALWRGTPYRDSVFGNEEALKSIKGKDVTDFYKRWVRRRNVVISACSDRPPEVIRDLLERYLKKLPQGEVPALPVPIPQLAERGLASEVRKKDEAYISTAYLLPGFSRENYVRMVLLDTLIGGGIGNRLWPLRARLKLAYNIGTQSQGFAGCGRLCIYVQVSPDRLAEARTALAKEMEVLAAAGIGTEEYHMVRELAIADHWRRLENKGGRVDSMGFFEIMGLSCTFIDRFPEEVLALSLEEFNGFIRRTLAPSNRSEAVIAPQPIGDGS